MPERFSIISFNLHSWCPGLNFTFGSINHETQALRGSGMCAICTKTAWPVSMSRVQALSTTSFVHCLPKTSNFGETGLQVVGITWSDQGRPSMCSLERVLLFLYGPELGHPLNLLQVPLIILELPRIWKVLSNDGFYWKILPALQRNNNINSTWNSSKNMKEGHPSSSFGILGYQNQRLCKQSNCGFISLLSMDSKNTNKILVQIQQ